MYYIKKTVYYVLFMGILREVWLNACLDVSLDNMYDWEGILREAELMGQELLAGLTVEFDVA
jgi:hypothetical protein